jgi:phosphatidylserine synthase
MRFLRQPSFLIHLLTLSGLALAFGGMVLAAERHFDWAARLLLSILVIDHLDGTLARTLHVKEKIPQVSGETLDIVTDIIGLTVAPMFFFYQANVFLSELALPVCLAAVMTCSLKYAMKRQTLEQGYSLGAPPAYFSVFLFYFLKIPPVWTTIYVVGLFVLCLLPIRYPISSIVTTHWKPGWQSMTNYLSFLAMPFALFWLDRAPAAIYWVLLTNILVQLLVMPLLLAVKLIQPGFRRVY